MAARGMKFGIFLAPFHRLGENPTLAMARAAMPVSFAEDRLYPAAIEHRTHEGIAP